jgi:sulfatase modifying factor 1
MTQPPVKDPGRRRLLSSLIEQLLESVIEGIRAFNRELEALPPQRAQDSELAAKVESLEAEVESLEAEVESLEAEIAARMDASEEAVRQQMEEIEARSQRGEAQIAQLSQTMRDQAERQAQQAERQAQQMEEILKLLQRLPDPERRKRFLARLRDLALVLAGATGGALFQTVIQEEIYPPLRERFLAIAERVSTWLEPPAAAEGAGAQADLRPLGEGFWDWVTVPAGEFLMGSRKWIDQQAMEDEMPQHWVYVAAFRISRTPVTVAQFQAFVEATGYVTTAENEGANYVWGGIYWQFIQGADWRHPRGPESSIAAKMQHPVTCVSWEDAQAFCRWAGVRLPTEAEWEKAARGTDGRIWPWGNIWDAGRCNTWEGGPQDTTPVGAYPGGASPYGVLDMAGNVWEWTSSLYKPYPYEAHDGREDPTAEGGRVVRGGSWNCNQDVARCAIRYWNLPRDSLDYLGFRVVSPIGSGS